MSETTPPAIDRPPRRLSAPSQGAHLFGLDLRRQIRSRKTVLLFLVQLLPAIIAVITLLLGDRDGLDLFESTVETVYLPLLLPLAALFFGGPTVVDEVEGRTITYLTLRPLPRSTLFLSKLTTSMVLAVAVTAIPIILFFTVCVVGSPASFGNGLSLLGSAVAATTAGAIAYTAIFAFLGVIFASTLLPGIAYFVFVELILAAIPIIEFISVKFHLFTLGGFQQSADGEQGIRDQMAEFLLNQPLEFDWWVGLLYLGTVTAGAVILSALVFRNRQFHV